MESAGGNHIKGVIEALLFVSEKPVMIDQIKEVLEGVDAAMVRDCITELKNEYEARVSGMVIVEIAGGYQMLSSSNYSMAIRKFFKTRHKEKLSKPSLETLAIVAYKQPVTRLDIELIRGVNSDGVTEHLLIKGLIKIVGRKDVPGKPYLYGTTKQFLEYFGLKSLADLPKLEDFSSLQPTDEDRKEETILPLSQEEQLAVNSGQVPAESLSAEAAVENVSQPASEVSSPETSSQEETP